MKNISLITHDELFAASYVDRWHMLRIQRPQSNAEHSYRVAVMAVKFMDLLEQQPGGPIWWTSARGEVLEHALTHDSDEVMTGDTPGFIKQAYPDIRRATALFWRDRTPDEPRDSVRWLVKLADIAEGYIFYYTNGASGPAHASPRRDWALSNAVTALIAHLAKGPTLFPTVAPDFFNLGLKKIIVEDRLGIDISHG